ncbi:MAG: NAD(P)/FAD-dependent oxidoreductase [Robiginitomaculum sp.]|nr:NAD(P)/FAD-dependent oxidoreductase [Robiginitomaculum sp.]
MTDTVFDVIIIGAGAAGLMCAATAGQNGRKVLLLDHAKKAGEKIRISGGGRCNFTNLYCSPDNFISQNPHFCKSALAGFDQHDFISLVEKYNISWHEKTLGQLFCDGRSIQIIDMLLAECAIGSVKVKLNTKISEVQHQGSEFLITTNTGEFTAKSLVMACGGLSIPKMGATGFGYQIAKQFDLKIIDTVPALVPFSLEQAFGQPIAGLSGISLPVRVMCNAASFDEAMLFTHRGLSGPAILQISSYWSPGDKVRVDLLPDIDFLAKAKSARTTNPKQSPLGFLSGLLPKRLASYIAALISQQRMGDISDRALSSLATDLQSWSFVPTNTLGYKIAEVTRGGIDTNELSSKTMQVKSVPSLYFIGEVVDVTGHLGGHNFQWAWASGYACGRAL